MAVVVWFKVGEGEEDTDDEAENVCRFFFFFYMNPLCSSSQDHYTWHFCVRFRGRVRFADERLYAKKREGRFRRIRKREVAVFYVQM